MSIEKDQILNEYYTTKEVADILGLSLRTITTYRAAKKNLPPHIIVGKRILYPISDFRKWLQKQPRKGGSNAKKK